MPRVDRPCGDDCNRSTCKPTRCDGRIPWDELPCREFCNHYGGGRCAPGRCGSPYERDDPRFWLGRGSEPVAGRPFGWAHTMQERAIWAHLLATGRDPRENIRYALLPAKIKTRLERDYHHRKPPIGVRRTGTTASREFTREELRHLVDLFDGANDPLSAAIADKARALLEL